MLIVFYQTKMETKTDQSMRVSTPRLEENILEATLQDSPIDLSQVYRKVRNKIGTTITGTQQSTYACGKHDRETARGSKTNNRRKSRYYYCGRPKRYYGFKKIEQIENTNVNTNNNNEVTEQENQLTTEHRPMKKKLRRTIYLQRQ